MKHTIITILVIVIAVLFWKSQQPRLDLYDKWYACMYQGWDYDRCDKEIYGN